MLSGEVTQLTWALHFAQADLITWRDGDWLNAQEDVEELIIPRRGEPRLRESETALAAISLWRLDRRGRRTPSDPAEIRAWLTSLQQALQVLLRRLFPEHRLAKMTAPVADEEGAPGEKRFMLLPFTGEAVLLAEPPFQRLQMFYAPKGENRQETFVKGTVLRVMDLLTRVDLDRIKKCPECGRLFIAVRRQRFDTPQCSSRDRVRRFREQATRRTSSGRRSRRKRRSP